MTIWIVGEEMRAVRYILSLYSMHHRLLRCVSLDGQWGLTFLLSKKSEMYENNPNMKVNTWMQKKRSRGGRGIARVVDGRVREGVTEAPGGGGESPKLWKRGDTVL